MTSYEQPAPGPWRSVEETPELSLGAVRRTTSTDLIHSGGFLDPVTADVRGRDVRQIDGRLETVDEVDLVVVVDGGTGQVLSVEGGSSHHARPVLEGRNVRRGLGRSVVESMPEAAARRSLLFSVLEDFNGAFLVSGYAPLRQGRLGVTVDGASRAEAQQDVCAGWARGGVIVELLRSAGETAVPFGPPAPPITERHDRWHATAPAPIGTVRRLRSLDVQSPGGTGGVVRVRSHLRDSYRSEEEEMVMHEYLVRAQVDRSTGTLTAVDVEPRVLPWRACPSASDSAGALVGARVEDLPGRVRAELVGPSTCTHLNSTMRSLADVQALLAIGAGGVA